MIFIAGNLWHIHWMKRSAIIRKRASQPCSRARASSPSCLIRSTLPSADKVVQPGPSMRSYRTCKYSWRLRTKTVCTVKADWIFFSKSTEPFFQVRSQIGSSWSVSSVNLWRWTRRSYSMRGLTSYLPLEAGWECSWAGHSIKCTLTALITLSKCMLDDKFAA